MSEYQCYQWKRLGRSLSPKQRKEVSDLSSHISVTSDSAEVTYQWGDFKHDPLAVLAAYFDIFLYEANWGTQQIAFRFDPHSIQSADLRKFVIEDVIVVEERKGQVILEACFDENWVEPSYCYHDEYEETDWRLDAFETVYRQVVEGDYRGLFLLWLKACEMCSQDEESWTIELPKGLAQLGDEHRILSDFVEVNPGLIKQAAERSAPLSKRRRKEEQLDRNLDKLTPERKEDLLRELVIGDAVGAQNALIRELRTLGDQPRPKLSGKTVNYVELAEAARREAEQEALRIKEEKEKRRHEYLVELGTREDALWDRVHELVSEKKTKAYEEAVLLLRGLEDLWISREDRDHFLAAVEVVAEEFPRLVGFRGKLEIAGWLQPKKNDRWLEDRRAQWQKQNPLERELNLEWL